MIMNWGLRKELYRWRKPMPPNGAADLRGALDPKILVVRFFDRAILHPDGG